MFSKILVANRGEIAVRVIRACRELRVPSVAIFSDVDRDALHVRVADEAYPCGAAAARESYLNADRVLEIARRSGADAIHPGYGFLSENGEFADACSRAGIAFIGPSGDVIRAMGDKVTSRRTAQAAGVPIVPGATVAQTDSEAAAFAREIGFPVMVKASRGGGGRGLRLVREDSELAAALVRARSEAEASFGDERLYVEKWIECPRHIEVQVLADSHAAAIHLGERECSIQRRHQKLIEEAPAHGVSPELRERLGDAALAMVHAVGYVGAGTCEFLLDPSGEFYFLEMNTRVQVEHAITEAITGIDIVKEMIRLAAGEPLEISQSDLEFRGHAIEARVYAEDPDRGFLPSPGVISVFRPPGGCGVRVDSGVQAGTTVGVHYDPMLAKLVVWGRDRAEALVRLETAVAEFVVQGLRTTLAFHHRALRHPAFRDGAYDTGFVAAVEQPSTGDGAADSSTSIAARRVATFVAAVAQHRADGTGTSRRLYRIDEKKGPSVELVLSGIGKDQFEVRDGDRAFALDVAHRDGAADSFIVDGAQYEATVDPKPKRGFAIGVAGRVFQLEVVALG